MRSTPISWNLTALTTPVPNPVHGGPIPAANTHIVRGRCKPIVTHSAGKCRPARLNPRMLRHLLLRGCSGHTCGGMRCWHLLQRRTGLPHITDATANTMYAGHKLECQMDDMRSPILGVFS